MPTQHSLSLRHCLCRENPVEDSSEHAAAYDDAQKKGANLRGMRRCYRLFVQLLQDFNHPIGTHAHLAGASFHVRGGR